MEVKQFEYKPLAHYSYAVMSNGEMAVIDPERDASQYYAFAKANNAKIIAVLETHPHADFVSSHLEIRETTGATIYNSKKLGADYPHQTFDEGDSIKIGNATLRAINTPGHSPDSITIVAEGEGKTALFTGDTLFIGDVGRPDLREKAGNMQAKREELAEMMYETMQSKYNDLPDEAIVYPAHGAGSLCGKGMSDDSSSTLGEERKNNWALKENDKQEFMDTLLDGQPFIPFYFSYDVEMNKQGAPSLQPSVENVPFAERAHTDGLIIDTRDESDFKRGHLKGSINIMAVSDNAKFETWLGSIVLPDEKFTLVVADKNDREKLLKRTAKIGYEQLVKQVITLPEDGLQTTPELDLSHFESNPEEYTIVDIRNRSEINEGNFFENAHEHPLNELRETADKIPTDKPIIVHCAGGYRSAAGSSILNLELKGAKVYDLSDDVSKFK
jgi:glyoxylase-like metal-dependent hydrolase (beta-lactamase superfamily II)